MNIVEILNAAPYFTGLEEDLRKELGKIAVVKEYQSGEIIFTENDPGLGFHLMAEGLVKIFKRAPDGKEQILHLFGPGEPFGEVAIFLGLGYPAWAQALEDSVTLFFPRMALRELIALNPDLAFGLLAVLSLRLVRFTRMLEDLTLKEAPARLAAFILELSRAENDADQVRLGVSKSQLASLLGTAPETISRAISRLKTSGLISETKSTIKILDRGRLDRMSRGL